MHAFRERLAVPVCAVLEREVLEANQGKQDEVAENGNEGEEQDPRPGVRVARSTRDDRRPSTRRSSSQVVAGA